jgi:hypothetical protein
MITRLVTSQTAKITSLVEHYQLVIQELCLYARAVAQVAALEQAGRKQAPQTPVA